MIPISKWGFVVRKMHETGGEEVRKTWIRPGIEQSEERLNRVKMKREAGNLDLLTEMSHLKVPGFP